MNYHENKFWKNELRTGFHAMGHVCRIESHATAIGVPDVNLCMRGGIIWDIELKHNRGTNKVSMRGQQRMWHKRRKEAGGNCGFLTKITEAGKSDHVLWSHSKIPHLEEDSVADWFRYADYVWEGRIDWAVFEEILRTYTNVGPR